MAEVKDGIFLDLMTEDRIEIFGDLGMEGTVLF